jgi:hypothetical protein
VRRAALSWIVFDVVLAGLGLLVVEPGSGAFILSALMLAVGVLCGLALALVHRFAR